MTLTLDITTVPPWASPRAILGAEDADALAALMTRIEGDHPTGFCLGAVEIREVMGGQAANVFEGAYDGDELVAYTTVLPGRPDESGLHVILFGDVDPARLGEGIGTLMLTRSLDRARAIHAAARARGAGTVRGRRARGSRGPGRPGGAGRDAPRTAQLPHGRRPRATVRGRAAGRVLRHRVRPGGRRGAPAGAQRRLRRPSRPRRMPAPTSGRCSWWVPPTPGTGSRPIARDARRRGRRLRPRPRVRRAAVGRAGPRGPRPLRRHPPGAPRPRAGDGTARRGAGPRERGRLRDRQPQRRHGQPHRCARHLRAGRLPAALPPGLLPPRRSPPVGDRLSR